VDEHFITPPPSAHLLSSLSGIFIVWLLEQVSMPRDGRASAPIVTPRTIAADAAMAAILVRNMELSNLAGLTSADSWSWKRGKWFDAGASVRGCWK